MNEHLEEALRRLRYTVGGRYDSTIILWEQATALMLEFDRLGSAQLDRDEMRAILVSFEMTECNSGGVSDTHIRLKEKIEAILRKGEK